MVQNPTNPDSQLGASFWQDVEYELILFNYLRICIPRDLAYMLNSFCPIVKDLNLGAVDCLRSEQNPK